MVFFFQMGSSKTDSDLKSHLVTEICSISNRAISCAQRHHRHHFHSNGKNIGKPFLDWYLVLTVDENAGLDIIRKNYLRLALLLHPDKNKHPKADTAFKLVSEAYACLSDNARRTAFNVDRQKNFCVKCRDIQDQKSDPPIPSNPKVRRGITRVKSPRMLQRMKDLRARLAEEANVIESCLKANAASRISVSSRKELPTFNPTDYLSQGYPHYTARNHKNLENFRHFMSKNHVVHALSVKPSSLDCIL